MRLHRDDYTTPLIKQTIVERVRFGQLLLLPVFELILFVTPIYATDFTGRVISVLDGDTIEVLHNRHPERIRLQGIDCPERGQAFGTKAKQATSALVFGKEVTVKDHGRDRFGRTIGTVVMPEGTNVNHDLLKTGMCWWYRKYAPGDSNLERLEKDAREGKKGLWADPQPVPPWEWRKRSR